MKNIFKMLFSFFIVSGLWSCAKDENRVIFMGGTPPVLTSSNTGDIPLSKDIQNNEAVVFSWTNPEFQFNTGISSQDVSYALQFDSTGANFSSPDMQELSFAKDLKSSVTVKVLNGVLGKLGMLEDISHNMDVRLKASFVGGAEPIYSNVVHFTATPYLDVVVPLPLSGNLYLIGSVTDPNWTNPVKIPDQQFTKTSSTTYEITIDLTGGQEFLVIPDNGSWGSKYAITRGTTPAATWRAGGTFGFNSGDNFYGPAESGNYTIVLNFKTGKFTITKN